MNIYHTTASGLLNHFFGTGIQGKPATLAFGLTTVPPTNNSITEVGNSNSYARVAYTLNTVPFSGINPYPNWSYPVELSGIVYNNNQVSFAVATGSWGNVSGAFIADSASYGAGNVLFYTSLTTPKDIQVNDQFYIPQSGCSVRFY